MRKSILLSGGIVFLACALVMTMAWSSATPLPAVKDVLAVYKGQTPVMIGARDAVSEERSYHRRNYVLLPSFKFVEVEQTGNALPTVRDDGSDYVKFLGFAVVIFLLDWWRRSRSDANRGT